MNDTDERQDIVENKNIPISNELESEQNSEGKETVAPNMFIRAWNFLKRSWLKFREKHPGIAQFLIFFVVSNGVTLLQMILMPLFKLIFAQTGLVGINFQIFPVGSNVDGSQYYIFNYGSGAIQSNGTGGGLAYFLAVQITMAIAQVINFFSQRKLTFKHTGNAWFAAMWYFIAYIAITFLAGAAQGFYKAPIYKLLIGWWGGFGEGVADVITMIINSAISFWVFFPIFKLIFKNKKEAGQKSVETEDTKGESA